MINLLMMKICFHNLVIKMIYSQFLRNFKMFIQKSKIMLNLNKLFRFFRISKIKKNSILKGNRSNYKVSTIK